MNASAAIANVQARGTGLEASGEAFQSKRQLFPLATSLVPLAWPVGLQPLYVRRGTSTTLAASLTFGL